MALIALTVASIAIDVGAAIYRMLHKTPIAQPIVDQVSLSANGAPIPFGYGTVRIGGQVFWSSGITFDQRNQSAKGGPSVTYFDFYASVAVAFGEGPMCLKRIWGDSKLIYMDPGTTTSEYPVEDFPAYDPTALYNPGNIVGYLGQVYEALVVSTGVSPPSDITKWQLISDYPPWSATTDYSSGEVVKYNGILWVAQAASLDFAPGNGDTTTVNGVTVPYWKTLAQAYPQPVFYPGDEVQLPDPTIQAVEGVAFTPAHRGLGYAVITRLPLLQFGNRVPNLRGEVQYLKVQNIL
ncbi:MAG TPA: hypothetical protein VG456_10790 [Candidatus Sulfopaludibacter sp.]|jgi:hypothetical protein|nr:hypothetical protein [Candidatus Sulfopaludibacter sp.]